MSEIGLGGPQICHSPPMPALTTLVPHVTTERLLLRELRKRDFDAYAESMADPVATAHLSGVLDRRAAWRTFAAASGMWMLDGAGWWAVELRETQEIVGTVGAFFRESCPDLEIGWTVFRRFWRRGFGTEAARAALAFGLHAHGKTRAIAHISSANVASVRVSEHLGMRYERDVDFFGEPVGRYAVES